jgi:hypothetical protein
MARQARVDHRYYELDHIIPLSLGGAARDPSNLQLQPWPEARRKDAVEMELSNAVCEGRMPLAEAHRRVALKLNRL